jgi:hypothetical protein
MFRNLGRDTLAKRNLSLEEGRTTMLRAKLLRVAADRDYKPLFAY